MWWRTVLAIVSALLPWSAGGECARACAPFDATFIQLHGDQLAYDQARWRSELELVRDLDLKLVIVQFTGDRHGSYDRNGHKPVADLLAAAKELDIHVMLGLSDDPTWPREAASKHLPPPLDNPRAAKALGELCKQSPVCDGWYLSQEIDDSTWASPQRTKALRAHVAQAARALRELAPGKQLALAPFFTGAHAPEQHARWWLEVLEPGAIDIVMLQDGVGTGRATPERAGAYLAALRLPLATIGVELWSVAELFHQRHGTPLDDEPFEAVPIDPALLRKSLATERPLVARVVAFAVLDYMNPKRGHRARALFRDYATRCRAALTQRTAC
jgi:hypothetical protein